MTGHGYIQTLFYKLPSASPKRLLKFSRPERALNDIEGGQRQHTTVMNSSVSSRTTSLIFWAFARRQNALLADTATSRGIYLRSAYSTSLGQTDEMEASNNRAINSQNKEVKDSEDGVPEHRTSGPSLMSFDLGSLKPIYSSMSSNNQGSQPESNVDYRGDARKHYKESPEKVSENLQSRSVRAPEFQKESGSEHVANPTVNHNARFEVRDFFMVFHQNF